MGVDRKKTQKRIKPLLERFREDQQRHEYHDALLEHALKGNCGDRSFRAWKESALRDILDMANNSPRMTIIGADLSADLELACEIVMPVPRRPLDGKLQIGHFAVFQLVYVDRWRRVAPHGWEPLSLIYPRDAFHPNVSARFDVQGACCLGRLPPSVRPKELLLMGYFLASNQDMNLDERDPEGVLNREACIYYRAHPEYLPLTQAGLYDPWSPEEQVDGPSS